MQVIGHHRPDGDCIGSILGLHYILDHMGIEHAVSAGQMNLPGYSIMPGYDRVEPEPRADLNPDLVIFSDCANPDRAFPDWPIPANSINIDHHESNSLFAAINWVDGGCASASEMIYELAVAAQVPLHSDFANALLLGIMTDTGCFRYSSVGPKQFEISAELVRAGADVTLISQAAYEDRAPRSVELMGKVLASIEYYCDGRLACGEVGTDLLDLVGGTGALPENLSGELRSIRGVDVSILFVELPEGGLRASFRAQGTVNVSDLAGNFGGGGHPNAAGLTIEQGNFRTLKTGIIEKACEVVSASGA